MPYERHEQQLIDKFVEKLKGVTENALKICGSEYIHNQRCGAKKLADLEFTSASGQRWAIEAKYGSKTDKANEVHKMFGNLLRETGRANRDGCRIALLLPACREEYFRERVRLIPRVKFIGFGELVPVKAVFVFDETRQSFRQVTWPEFYGGS